MSSRQSVDLEVSSRPMHEKYGVPLEDWKQWRTELNNALVKKMFTGEPGPGFVPFKEYLEYPGDGATAGTDRPRNLLIYSNAAEEKTHLKKNEFLNYGIPRVATDAAERNPKYLPKDGSASSESGSSDEGGEEEVEETMTYTLGYTESKDATTQTGVQTRKLKAQKAGEDPVLNYTVYGGTEGKNYSIYKGTPDQIMGSTERQPRKAKRKKSDKKLPRTQSPDKQVASHYDFYTGHKTYLIRRKKSKHLRRSAMPNKLPRTGFEAEPDAFMGKYGYHVYSGDYPEVTYLGNDKHAGRLVRVLVR